MRVVIEMITIFLMLVILVICNCTFFIHILSTNGLFIEERMPNQSRKSSAKPTAQTLQQYIAECLISDDDPGLLFNWNPEVVDQFVLVANGLAIPQPLWIMTAPGHIVPATLQQNIVDHLAIVGGGNFGQILIAPNDLLQFGNVRDRLRDIELDPFMQAAFQHIPAGSLLATTAILHDRTNVKGTPSARVSPQAPARQLFG